jgi:hypothetical protein
VRTHLSGNTYTQLDAVHMPSSFAKNCPLEVQFKKSPKIHFYRNIQKIIKSLWGIKSEHHSKHVKSSSEVSELPLQVFDSFQCPSKKEVQYDQLSRSTSILADKSICKCFLSGSAFVKQHEVYVFMSRIKVHLIKLMLKKEVKTTTTIWHEKYIH